MAAFAFVSAPAFFLSWLLNMLLASIWYAQPVFGRTCGVLAHGPKKEYPPQPAGLAASAIGSAMAFPFVAFVLGAVDCRSWFEGALWGLLLALFNVGLNCMHCLFEDRPFRLYAIHAGFHLLSLPTVGGVLGLLCARPSY